MNGNKFDSDISIICPMDWRMWCRQLMDPDTLTAREHRLKFSTEIGWQVPVIQMRVTLFFFSLEKQQQRTHGFLCVWSMSLHESLNEIYRETQRIRARVSLLFTQGRHVVPFSFPLSLLASCLWSSRSFGHAVKTPQKVVNVYTTA